MTREPVVSLVVGLIVAACALLVAFGVPVTPEQVTALGGFAVAAIGLAVWVRSKVRPTAKGEAGEKGQVEPITLLIYVIVAIILIVVLFKVLDRL